MKDKPKRKVNNLPAKHSVNKSGAGPHRSAKDYKRNPKHKRQGEDNDRL